MENTFQEFVMGQIQAMLQEKPDPLVCSWLQKTFEPAIEKIKDVAKNEGASSLDDLSKIIERSGFYESLGEVATKSVLQVLCARLVKPLEEELAARGNKSLSSER